MKGRLSTKEQPLFPIRKDGPEQDKSFEPKVGTRLSFGSPMGLQSLQRNIGNQALVGLLEQSAPLRVQREGEGTTVKDRQKFFQSGSSSLEKKGKTNDKPIPGLTDRIISFQNALKIFQDLERNPKATEQPLPEVTPSTSNEPENAQEPSTGPESTYGKYKEVPRLTSESRTNPEGSSGETTKTTPSVPETESFGGNKFTGKSLKDDYITGERANLDKKQKGLAFAKWSPSDWKARYVKYLSDEERTGYELKLLKEKGSTLFLLGNTALDTTNMERTTTLVGDDGKPKSGAGKMIFVMDVDGKIYVANEGAETKTGESVTEGERWRFNHSSFVRGQAIAAAGEMWFKGGTLKGISDESGHYWPGTEEMLQLLRNLRDHGVSLRGVVLQLRGKQVDAELALEQNDVGIAKESVKKFDKNVEKFHAKLKNGKVKFDIFDKAIAALNRSSEHDTGVDLTPKARELLEVLKPAAADVDDSLKDDDPSVEACSEDANSIWRASSAIDRVDDSIISVKGFNAADDLDTELDNLKEEAEKAKDTDPDADPKLNFTAARGLISTVVAELGSASPRKRDDTALDELEDKGSNLEEVRENIGAAEKALDKLQRGKGTAKLEDLEADHADEFVRLVQIAAARANLTIDDVVELIKKDVIEEKDEPNDDLVGIMNALIANSGTDFLKSTDWNALKEAN